MSGWHAAMSPSSIERLLTCPASYFASQGKSLPSRRDTVEGTAAHDLHEWALATGHKAADRVLDTVTVVEHDRTWEIVVDDLMAAAVQESVDVCNEIDGLIYVEKRVDTSAYCPLPDQSGTADFIAIDYKRKTLHVRDYKHGLGVRVDVYTNPQLIYYALGALHDLCDVFEIEKVVLGIHQPRLDSISLWESTPAELHAIGTFFKRQLMRCLDPKAPYVPTPKSCQFCPNKFTCKARAEQISRMSIGLFDDLDMIDGFDTPMSATMPEPDLLTTEELVSVHRHAESVSTFLRDVKARLMHLALHGEPVPGFKLVEGGMTHRKWVDEVSEREAANFLLAQGVPPSHIFKTVRPSPAQAEGLLPKRVRSELKQFWIKPAGKPQLVSDTDPRPALEPVGVSMFDDLDADDFS